MYSTASLQSTPFRRRHDDAASGANFVHKYAEQLSIDLSRITLAGNGAGELGATAHFEMPYPKLAGLHYITRDTLLTDYKMYLLHTDRQHPKASPLWRGDFNDLLPTRIIIAKFDPLCDEDEVLYYHLTAQGVDCTCQRCLGFIHGFFQLGEISQAAHSVMQDIA